MERCELAIYFIVAFFVGIHLAEGRKAVCVLTGGTASGVSGTVTFTQNEGEHVVISIKATGLDPIPVGSNVSNLHGFHVHQYGDLSRGCLSTGGHYNPHQVDHGGPTDDISNRHVGDLGNVAQESDGTISTTLTDHLVSLFGECSVIGRAVVLHAKEDDLGRGNTAGSKTTGNAGARLACCVIGLANEN